MTVIPIAGSIFPWALSHIFGKKGRRNAVLLVFFTRMTVLVYRFQAVDVHMGIDLCGR